jgi:hypothetical protein
MNYTDLCERFGHENWTNFGTDPDADEWPLPATVKPSTGGRK